VDSLIDISYGLIDQIKLNAAVNRRLLRLVLL
jgi:hypothetical protein